MDDFITTSRENPLGIRILHLTCRIATPLLAMAWASLPGDLWASDNTSGNDLRIARVGQNCAECFELPPCEIPSPNPCEPGQVPTLPAEPMPGTAEATDQPEQPLDRAMEDRPSDRNLFDNQPPSRSSSSLPSGLGAVAAADSPDVHMIGDFFSNGYFLGGMDGAATVPSAGGDRRFKATDNLSPLPQDRVFFNYHHFHNAVYDIYGDDQNVDRFTLGLERTCLDDTISFEVRLPMTSGLDSLQDFRDQDSLAGEVGNLALTFKAFLWQWRSLKFAAGMAAVLPTAEDGIVEGDSTLTVFRNESVHLQPYLGINCSQPGRRLFSTTYIGVDVDVSGNEILTGFSGNGSQLVSLGRIEDPALFYCDTQIGYWCYQDYGHIGYLNGIAPVVEIHYSQILSDPENIVGSYENPFGQVSLVNLTMGVVFDFRRNQQVSVYGAAPLKKPEAVFNGQLVSPVFDSELGVQWVCRY